MPSTFNVISLGNQSDMDSVEGNNIAESAQSLVGLSFGAPGDALVNYVQELSVGDDAYSDNGNSYYDMNGSSSEAFNIDGGPDQVFDGTAVFEATITYVDGTTADISAVIFQDVDGNTYLSPEYSANADQSALEAKPIQSLSLDSMLGNRYSGMTGSRQSFDYVACFAAGTAITTSEGETLVEDIQQGDLVLTRDHGLRPVTWIGTATGPAEGAWQPICIQAGALAKDVPSRQLFLSQQHRVLVSSHIAERMTGQSEVLVAAKKLVELPGIDFAVGFDLVTYFHIQLDQHEIVFAEGAPAESLLRSSRLDQEIVPFLRTKSAISKPVNGCKAESARFIPSGQIQKGLVRRHLKNGQPILQL